MNDGAWEPLRRFTQARIGLGRAGHALPTGALLDFQLAHARARDAVHLPWDIEGFAAAVRALGSECLILETPVADRGEYLRRPDLGRRLTEAARARVAAWAGPDIDIALVVTNGLSSAAVEAHGLPLLRAILERYHALGFKPGPVCVVGNGRVAVSDVIGAALRARLAVIVVGERPGLSAADSLGIYLTYGPKVGNTDAGRNCLSNIRPPEGLDYAAAAAKLAYLTVEALRRGLSGVDLKDEMALPGRDGAVLDAIPQL
ncbi:ethanolamine ammonia-lyase subunit EutC [Methylomagnum ishizawai]|uniref:ethanolamine ammonia-lyase subunit EutC n=1 Tax=Methylomagnum ishizawai TaxID=1760988 RepID=UPI001C336701|nr:ethanolamine ammonia-lyase subunit EutC [Methylomagnum ishizawai]BBL74268.1 ethanolamine ammonia-lyase light chain [Methylomagnum ishizawai]